MGYKAEAREGYAKENVDSTQVRQRKIDQQGIDKLVYDALSADNGLAQLLSGENLAGGNSSSSKTLMAQDFMTKVIGELAMITAPEVTENDTVKRNRDRSFMGGAEGSSVICTELMRQKKLSEELHAKGHDHWLTIPIETKIGYWVWAPHVVPLMQKSERLSKVLAPIAQSRCEMVAEGKFKLLGALTIYIGHPICNIIGRYYLARKRREYQSAT